MAVELQNCAHPLFHTPGSNSKHTWMRGWQYQNRSQYSLTNGGYATKVVVCWVCIYLIPLISLRSGLFLSLAVERCAGTFICTAAHQVSFCVTGNDSKISPGVSYKFSASTLCWLQRSWLHLLEVGGRAALPRLTTIFKIIFYTIVN